jgi:hypothetical protein
MALFTRGFLKKFCSYFSIMSTLSVSVVLIYSFLQIINLIMDIPGTL